MVCKTSASESHEHTTMNAAILCRVICVYDVLNKVDTGGRSVHYVMSQSFLLFIGKGGKNTPEELKKSKKKVPLLHEYLQHNHNNESCK